MRKDKRDGAPPEGDIGEHFGRRE
ncbi:MAG: hypothetical protein QOG69_1285, partial [Actinomycetota bacterium]|nr:hypothetical protein [Actinomycetota bacterium]